MIKTVVVCEAQVPDSLAMVISRAFTGRSPRGLTAREPSTPVASF